MLLEHNKTIPFAELGLIVLDSSKELGAKINDYLVQRRKDNYEYGEDSYIVNTNEVRFSNGEGKVVLSDTVRGKDIYILSDVGNYSCTYKMHGFLNHKSPDDHFQDIKRVVSAISGKAKRITVIMPLLYASRQHRRKGRESLDCSLALQELERLGVDDIITFDVHDPNVQNAIPAISFDNLYPTYEIVKTFLREEEELAINEDSMIVISPDTGAMDRSIYYSSVLGVDVGLFYKRRDHSTVVNGKNPIVQHEYMGRPIEGKNVLIVDDMIASGESVFDIVKELKARKANKIFVATSFVLFTEGIEKFNKFHEEGLIDAVYSTNLTYIPEDARKASWFKEVDMSKFISKIVDKLNHDCSIQPVLDATEGIKELIRNRK